ncbi:DUF4270 domain-containing protein [Mesonia aestuariivivens]|uniref:DUF4270 domain-containing protein n=1 Tax=Mesonia aestuariivivens TaxID=2796128 RepID=A0ABS6VXH3_9FLAO|nr:DUF4270 domain-containing protein [Mesonia aestuariivivens]MBW2960280.1 DUF4270 domain-containing protein [Mesonia aestuariivivens]
MKREWKAAKKYNYLAALAIVVSLFTACEEDFSEVGSSLVDNNNFNALLFDSSQIEAKTIKIKGAQTNSLNSFLLGVYNAPNYGKLTSNVVSQLTLNSANPNFGDNPEMDSVVLTIPYYSTATGVNGNKTTYQLDSIYGDAPINLSIYRNNYFIRSIDPDNDFEAQDYYSNQFNTFEENHGAEALLTLENFKPSPVEIITSEVASESEENATQITRSAPKLRVKLSNEDFESLILDRQGSPELSSNNNFTNYFRGLYFKTESINDDGNMSLLNFRSSEANITLYYTTTVSNTSESRVQREFKLNFGNNTFNVFDSEYQQVPNDNNLYLKGGAGSMAVVDLFTNQAQLDSIRSLNWLVNEANLTLYVNDEQVADDNLQPNRIFVYDINNNKVLLDYTNDYTKNEASPSISNIIHLGPLTKDENGNRYYKLRITGLVSNIIKRDSTNTKLGISVSSNVNLTATTKGKFENPQDELKNIPQAQVLTPRGTVLFGTEAAAPAKKLKLNIFYTQPE